MSFFELKARDIDGKERAMKDYVGKVILVVNVASHCGFTPQYAGLQSLYTEFKSRGLVVLGFPSNEFGGQEPGEEAEIQQFCALKFNVDFPMFAKVKVKKGEEQCQVYRFLTGDHPAPRWNFTKYLVGRDGRVIASFDSRVTPDGAELRGAIEKAL